MKWGGLLLALVAGCSGETLRDGVCYRGDALHCEGPCPSFDDKSAEFHAEMCRRSDYYRTEIGTCGAYRYTFEVDGYSSEKLYFDASGKLVARDGGGDIGFTCDGGDAYAVHYGADVACQETLTETICPGF